MKNLKHDNRVPADRELRHLSNSTQVVYRLRQIVRCLEIDMNLKSAETKFQTGSYVSVALPS